MPTALHLAAAQTATLLRVCNTMLLPVLGLLLLFAASSASAAEATLKRPTIVLVHGAFADSSSWDGVITPLLARGYPVVAASIPMRSVKSDAEYVGAILRSIDGPIVLVGHSYGGAVITNAATGNSNVTGLVYVAGFAPETGETGAQLSNRFPGSTLGPTLAPPVTLPDGSKDLYIRQEDYPAQFAADLSQTQAERMAVTQRPINEAALNEPSGAPAWKSIPSWFIFGSLDKNIPAAAHTFMADRANSKATVQVQGASHVVMISHPNAVVRLITQAAGVPEVAPSSSTQSADLASDPRARSQFDPAPVLLLPSEPPARLIVDAPAPDALARGYVVVRYRAENARIMPVYGPSALGVLPRIAHLHVTLDDLPWHWLDSSGEPLSINGLPPGPHKLLIELEDTTHRVMDSATINFEIPQRSASPR